MMVALRKDDGKNFSTLASMYGAVFLGHSTSPPVYCHLPGYLDLELFPTTQPLPSPSISEWRVHMY